MSDLGLDTRVEGGNGLYTATASESWEIWGPQGGVLAAFALRAAGAESTFPRPASLACHFLRAARFGQIDIQVESVRRARRAESLKVTLLQEDVPVLQAWAWTVAELEGIDHDGTEALGVPDPDELESWDAYLPGGEPFFPFWRNFDIRPVEPHPAKWLDATDPRWVMWSRLLDRPDLEDPFVDASRMLVVADSSMYPAATIAHDVPFPYVAPSLDLAVSFHAPGADSEWLLTEGVSPLSQAALVAGTARIWSRDGRLLASAMQQMLQRA